MNMGSNGTCLRCGADLKKCCCLNLEGNSHFEDLQKLGANLILKRAVSSLSHCIQSESTPRAFVTGDKDDGTSLSIRVAEYVESLQEALDFWKKALEYRNSIKR